MILNLSERIAPKAHSFSEIDFTELLIHREFRNHITILKVLVHKLIKLSSEVRQHSPLVFTPFCGHPLGVVPRPFYMASFSDLRQGLTAEGGMNVNPIPVLVPSSSLSLIVLQPLASDLIVAPLTKSSRLAH